MIKSRITLKQLEAFAFVVDTGTFRAAAKALGTTQPNISARIAALETALGVPLLIRGVGPVQLTDTGQTLLQKARKVLWAGEALLEEAGRCDLIEERLRLGVTELVACTWLQNFLHLLKQDYPRLRVELQVDLSTVIDAQLMANQLDLTFQSGPFKSNMSGTVSLGAEAYHWAASPDLAARLGSQPTVQMLFEHPILTHARHTQAGHALHRMAQDEGLDTAQIIHSSALSACLPLAYEGMGVALLPERLVQAEFASGQLHPLVTNWLPDPLMFFARYAGERAPLYVQKAARLAARAAQGSTQT